MPLVSIIVPSYNHEKYVNDLIDSILGLSYSNIQLIFADDNSIDSTYEIIESRINDLKKKTSNIIYYKNRTNLGIVSNLNQALSFSNGEFIKLIASDDILLPDSISNYINIMLKNKTCTYILGNAYIIDNDFHYGDMLPSKKAYKKDFKINEHTYENLLSGHSFCAPGAFFRRSTFDEFGFFDTNFIIEDYPYWIKSFDDRVIYIDECFVCYRYTIKDKISKKAFTKDINYYINLFDLIKYRTKNDEYLKKAAGFILTYTWKLKGAKNFNNKLKEKYKISYLSLYNNLLMSKLRNVKRKFITYFR